MELKPMDKMFYENDTGVVVIVTALIFTNARLSGVFLVAKDLFLVL